jgi:hypothetical protein
MASRVMARIPMFTRLAALCTQMCTANPDVVRIWRPRGSLRRGRSRRQKPGISHGCGAESGPDEEFIRLRVIADTQCGGWWMKPNRCDPRPRKLPALLRRSFPYQGGT